MFYGFFRGIGALNTSLILTIISLGTRVVLAYLLSSIPQLSQRGIWWSVPLGWALAAVWALLYIRNEKETSILIVKAIII